jgi:sulfate adenylyltransferase
MNNTHLIPPYGGQLVGLLTGHVPESYDQAPMHDLNRQQASVLELLINGALSPLSGFMTEADYQSVIDKQCLADGTYWPTSITLAIGAECAKAVQAAGTLVLRDEEGMVIAAMPSVSVYERDGATFVGGTVHAFREVVHYDFKHVRHTPQSIRQQFQQRGWQQVLGFQSHGFIHQAEVAMLHHLMHREECNLLLQPLVGDLRPDDRRLFGLVKAYEAVLPHFPQHMTTLSLLPFAGEIDAPSDLALRAIIARNYGVSHVIADAQHLEPNVLDAIGVTLISAPMMRYVPDQGRYEVNQEEDERLNETDLVQRIRTGQPVEPWVSYPDVLQEMAKIYPPPNKSGFTVFFTGLSGSGKSTIANALQLKLMEQGGRPVTLLDGDIVRQHLSSELGFSRKDRSINIRRIGFVASEISKNGGVAICAPIAPYAVDRTWVRELIEHNQGVFLEVYVATPLAECEKRDRKGLYAKARKGLIPDFTGVDDPYETPEHPDIVVDTLQMSADEAAHMLMLRLEKLGLL